MNSHCAPDPLSPLAAVAADASGPRFLVGRPRAVGFSGTLGDDPRSGARRRVG